MSKKEKENEMNKNTFIAIMTIVGVWILAGIAAFIASLVCFGYSGTTSEKVIGLILSILVGPFYWIYFGVNKNYCR